MSEFNSSVSVDDKIYNCLNLDHPKSFFLFAGAGSGKTRSLVEVLKRFRSENIGRLRRDGQKVAVITYTNAACDEIIRRLEFDSAFHVSTIHSFAWELIKSYTKDIKWWLKSSLEAEVADLREKQSKAKKSNTKTYVDRANKIDLKMRRLSLLPSIRRFTYSPNGNNSGRDSLNHSEVINLAADFIQSKPLMQSILVRKYPILLVDESQDTKRELIDSFFTLQTKQAANFSLGMFGDTMQRIYTDGKTDLGVNIPKDWERPAKEINYRCPKRVITLINKVRSQVDGQSQSANKSEEGVVRLFIVDNTSARHKIETEQKISVRMAQEAEDDKWNSQENVKILTLEHHMAESWKFFVIFQPSLCCR